LNDKKSRVFYFLIISLLNFVIACNFKCSQSDSSIPFVFFFLFISKKNSSIFLFIYERFFICISNTKKQKKKGEKKTLSRNLLLN